jgi:hypothetical protein
MAPELSDPSCADAEIAASNSADIYAFAMVVIEIFTGRLIRPSICVFVHIPESFPGAPPFAKVQSETKVIQKALAGERPKWPGGHQMIGMTDDVWKIVNACWDQDPRSRLPAFKVVNGLKEAITAFEEQRSNG